MEVYDSLPRGLRDVLKDEGANLAQIASSTLDYLVDFYGEHGAGVLIERLRAMKRG